MSATKEIIQTGNLSIAYLAVIQDLKTKNAPRDVIHLLENKRRAVDVKLRRMRNRENGKKEKRSVSDFPEILLVREVIDEDEDDARLVLADLQQLPNGAVTAAYRFKSKVRVNVSQTRTLSEL